MLLGNEGPDMRGTDDVTRAISDLAGLMIDRIEMAIGQGVAIAHALCPARAAP